MRIAIVYNNEEKKEECKFDFRKTAESAPIQVSGFSVPLRTSTSCSKIWCLVGSQSVNQGSTKRIQQMVLLLPLYHRISILKGTFLKIFKMSNEKAFLQKKVENRIVREVIRIFKILKSLENFSIFGLLL